MSLTKENYKIGDKVKLRYFKNKEEYDKVKNGKCAFYNEYCVMNYDKYDIILTISKIKYIYNVKQYEYRVIGKGYTGFNYLWEFQMEKYISLKDKIDYLKELIS